MTIVLPNSTAPSDITAAPADDATSIDAASHKDVIPASTVVFCVGRFQIVSLCWWCCDMRTMTIKVAAICPTNTATQI